MHGCGGAFFCCYLTRWRGQDGMDLFEQTRNSSQAPLATRMRPRNLAEMVGQHHLVGPQSLLRQAIEADTLPSMILHGPAGTGKTTIAYIIAQGTQSHFELLSAVSSGVEDFRRIAREATDRRKFHEQGTIVFIDEIHRLNKAQQDALLPSVEDGTFTLIGTTTENPYFTVVSPLLSRCRLFTLYSLEPQHIMALLERALTDSQRGLGELTMQIEEGALAHIAENAGGDARAALNALELAVVTTPPNDSGCRLVSLNQIEEALQQPVLKYDRAGDEHYDTISAYIKSMRGSDPDAAIYWLAKMLEAGEDPRFIARRLVIQAAEDVGLADPTALRVALNAADAVEYVGMPEAQIPLAMATIHLAVAPKSNSAYQAIAAARGDVRQEGGAQVPSHLAGGPRPEAEGEQYLYPHDHPSGWVKQSYLPPQLVSRQYYQPKDNPREQKIAEYLRKLRGEENSPAQREG